MVGGQLAESASTKSLTAKPAAVKTNDSQRPQQAAGNKAQQASNSKKAKENKEAAKEFENQPLSIQGEGTSAKHSYAATRKAILAKNRAST